MKKRREIALNKLFNFCVFIGVLCIWMSIEALIDGEIIFAVITRIVGVLFIVLPATFTPFCYSFDKDGVSLCYFFLPVERYVWNSVAEIEINNSRVHSLRHSVLDLFLDFLYGNVFSIKSTNDIKPRFYMKGNIRKSFRTKHLIKKYWDGTITGSVFDDIKEWYNKRKTKKQKKIKAHFNDKIVPAERLARAKTREWIKPFVNGIDIKMKYFYNTKGLKYLKSRPKEDYTYIVVVEFISAGQPHENELVTNSVDLLKVKFNKRFYQGVENKTAEKEFRIVVSDLLKMTENPQKNNF